MQKDTLILVLSCLGIAQALFLVVYLFTLKKRNDHAPVFLGLVILGLTVRIGKSILNVHFTLEPWQRNLGLSGILLTGPFLWFYGKALLAGMKRMEWRDYLHLTPFVLFVVFCWIVPNNGNRASYIIYTLIFAHLAVYVGASFVVFHQFRNRAHKQRTVWYRNLVIGVALIWLFYMGNLAGLFSFYIGGALFFSLLIYVFSFVFLQKHAFRLGKYNASNLEKSVSGQLMDSVKLLFSNEEVFLESSISLESVAKRLNVPPRKLSQAINENEHRNFSDFVTEHRIEKAKTLLIDPKYQHEKIVAIAYDCGFGNVTSFNLAFKAKTQLTPSEYRKRFQTA